MRAASLVVGPAMSGRNLPHDTAPSLGLGTRNKVKDRLCKSFSACEAVTTTAV